MAGFVACALLIAYALYAEHVLMLAPCPLCIFQRIAVILLGVILLLAALHAPHGFGRRVYALLAGIVAAGGVGVALWHVRLQHLPPDEVPVCGPGFDYIVEAFPLSEALRMIFTGSGECATSDWTFVGLSMPAWVAICLAILGLTFVWNNLRSPRDIGGFSPG